MPSDPRSIRARASRRAILVVLAAIAGGCGGAPGPAGPIELHVAAAASLKEVFVELERGFEAEHPGVDVVFNFAGSQVLAAQILAGAPADVFASADRAQVERAAPSGRVGPPTAFAKNRLVIIVPAGDTRVQTPSDLKQPGLRLVLAGPMVPAGAYARDALDRIDLTDRALANLVSNEEDVRGVVGKVVAGEADAGVVYATDVNEAVAAKLRVVAFAGAEDIEPTYWISSMYDSKQRGLAGEFIGAVSGPAGAAALQRRGFLPP